MREQTTQALAQLRAYDAATQQRGTLALGYASGTSPPG